MLNNHDSKGRWRGHANGEYLRGPRKKKSIKERFEKYFVKLENACWLWLGAKDKHGYGRFNVGYKTKNAYRVSYELYKGEVPVGLKLDHLCKTPSCVNPDHLEPVTHNVNYKRGESGKHLGAIHRAKTHCPKGHPYSGNNLIIRTTRTGTQRVCRQCERLRWKRK